MSNPRLAAVHFVGIFLEGLLYGVLIMVFSFNSYLHVERYCQRGSVDKVSKAMFAASICLFVGATIHLISNFCRIFYAVLETPGGQLVDVYLSNIREPTAIIGTSILALEIFLGDTMLLYRLRHVYQDNAWVLLSPCLIWLGTLICEAGSVLTISKTSLGNASSTHAKIDHWLIAGIALSLVFNVYCTAFISWRFWVNHHAITRRNTSQIRRMMRVFVESAAFWTLFVTLVFITLLFQSNIYYSFIEMTSPVIGISFCLLLARLNLESRETERSVQLSMLTNWSSGDVSFHNKDLSLRQTV